MRKICSLILAFLMLTFSFSLVGCAKEDDDVIYLNVYNWEDYIAEDDDANLIEEFEEYYLATYNKKVVVNYSTFGTNENMYNELQLSKVKVGDDYDYGYDLVCPSDYMIQKMIYEGMVEELDYTIAEGEEGSLSNYEKYVSRFIYNLFENQTDIDGNAINWNNYSIPYMFGTMGFVYNPDKLARSGDYKAGDENHWDFPWKAYSKNLGTIKDSIRDTYALAMGKVYSDELTALRNRYETDVNYTLEDYQRDLVNAFNRVDEETIEKVTKELIDLKGNVYGFEVDSGKRDMASEKIAINFAWSGDAVYTMDIADEAGTTLYYAVPEEGSNIWFDGWVMPKGANKIVAQEFINFLADPKNAIKNMNYIGYTSTVAGEKMFSECAVSWYGTHVLIESEPNDEDAVLVKGKYYTEEYFGDLSEEELSLMRNSDGTYNLIYPVYDAEEENIVDIEVCNDVEMMAYDVSIVLNTIEEYENGNKYYVWTEAENVNRQLFTQYPSEEVVNRCAIMKHLSNDEMKMLNDMWDEVKVSAIPNWLMWLIVGIILAIIIIVPVFSYLNKKGVHINLKLKNKNLTLVKKEVIK